MRALPAELDSITNRLEREPGEVSLINFRLESALVPTTRTSPRSKRRRRDVFQLKTADDARSKPG